MTDFAIAALNLSSQSTFQLARSLQWKIGNLRPKATPGGRKYFVDLNDVAMPASEARKLCEAEIIKRQTPPTKS